MAALYFAYYEGTDENQFLTDLDNKTEALLVYHAGSLVGFTTLQYYLPTWQGGPIRVVYSGDTIVDRAHWGQQALAYTWIAHMGEIMRQTPDLPMYWFLIVKGHRTYRYLPAFGKSFYPHWTIDRSDLKPLADALAREKFGDDYNPRTGVVEFSRSRGHLKQEIALPTPEECGKPAVRYFLQRNPDYRRGHELVCLCEISEQNMKPLTRRIFSQAAT
jgi:hypothetical protein